jgi:3alpha(or 20beta)-hydroxysteroid dehydrogenase
MARLEGKTALISGALGGIGSALSREFVKQGARVILGDLDTDRGLAFAEELGEQALFVKLNVSNENDWKHSVGLGTEQFGNIDILVNNAGLVYISSVLECDSTEFRRLMDVNLLGPMLGTKVVGAHMAKNGQGSIINMSSSTGLLGFNGLTAYGATKWGLRGMTKVAAKELGPLGIRVNSVHPGLTDTPMANPEALDRATLATVTGPQPVPRFADPAEIALACVYLASDESLFVCGAELAVDGGQSLGQYLDAPGKPDNF